MKRELLMGLGILLVASSMSYAQTAPATPSTQAAATSMRQQLSDNLTKAGYTNVKVMPDAFLVEANNKAGDPVTMFLSPDSMTVFTAEDPKGQDTKTALTPAKLTAAKPTAAK
jgi:hypothetical protein